MKSTKNNGKNVEQQGCLLCYNIVDNQTVMLFFHFRDFSGNFKKW